ncbi:MAG: class A beta-lactamase-related serine hydrolase [Patescibacteria group bacterium]|nr:class A beta-lactamase-related serine hydrolase [Patescibacteria group bacterium]
MTYLAHLALRPLYPRVSVARLAVVAETLLWAQRAVATISAALCLVIIVQLVYPHDYVRPFAQAATVPIAHTNQQTLQSRLEALNDRPVTLVVGPKTYHLKVRDTGSTINSQAMSQQLVSYDWHERLVPFSILHKAAIDTVQYQHNSVKQAALVASLTAENTVVPHDATLVKQADKSYVVVPHTDGYQVPPTAIQKSLADFDPLSITTMTIPRQTIAPAITTDVATATVEKLAATQKTPPTITYNGRTYSPFVEQIKAWSSVSAQPTAHQFTISYDTAAIRSWLGSQLPLVAQAPQNSIVTVVDGTITSQTTAQAGTGLDLDNTAASLAAALQSGTAQLAATTKTLAASTQVSRSYTPTNNGLNAIIKDWQADYPRLTAGVTFIELGGQGRQAGSNGDRQAVTASIYKLYVAWYVFKGIEAGSIDPNTPIAGKTTIGCLEAMLVVSDNPCAVALGAQYNWVAITNFVHDQGFTGTDISGMPLKSTPADTARFLQSLAAGKLLNSTDTAVFLGYMGRQIYRSAIPAGSPGSTVQDKVGFFPGVWNDAAIVYSPKSTYVLVVFTNGNQDAIKDLAARIHSLLQT